MTELDYDVLKAAVDGGSPAIRSITKLEPAGGPGDKIFPPTYVKEGRAETKYAFEKRRIDGQVVDTVLLDSVASQANRMEEALLEGWRRGELDFPVVRVDFSKQEGLEDLDTISTLQAPHRIADALLRDSLLGDKLFRFSDVGRAITDARPNHATGMYQHCPTALVFGVWDSTGPKGGLGAKFQRALVSEIVGIDAVTGVKTASRIDPAGIQRKVGDVYAAKDPEEEWTLDQAAAVKEKGKPVLFSRTGGKGEKGKPAGINHGNIPPSIDREAGGVTIDHAVQTTVLSLAALRRLRFQTKADGSRHSDDERDGAELAARTLLAALGLAAIVYQRENDFDLRSRSLLVATQPLLLEILPRDGAEPKAYGLTRESAQSLLASALAEAKKHGMGWERGPINLVPAPKLAELIRQSRSAMAETGEPGEDG